MGSLNVKYRITRPGFLLGRTRRAHRAYDKISMLFLLAITAARAFAQTPPPPPASPPSAPPPYQSVRYEEDWSYLRDRTRRTDFWDPVKYIPLDGQGNGYLTLGGEARIRYEAYQNPNWGRDLEGANGYLLQRYMLHADWHQGKGLRLFGQIKSGLEHGRAGGPRPFDKDSLDLHQAFVEVTTPFGAQGSLTVRAGRQELEFGSSRSCVDDIETPTISWPNYHSGRNGDYQRITPVEPLHELLHHPAMPSGRIEFFPAHPHEGAVGVPPGEAHARVLATGRSQVTGRSFNLIVAFERAKDAHGHRLGRAVAESSFHHFADYNWDPQSGAPSFVTEPPGAGVAREPHRLEDIKVYVRNLALWLAPR